MGVDFNNHTDRAEETGFVCVGALLSYENHIIWGFISADNDTALNYTMTTSTTHQHPVPELDVEIQVNLVVKADALGIAYTNNETLFHTVVHHETNHHFMMSAVGCHDRDWWLDWNWLWNGYGTFSETLHNASEMHRSNSMFYQNMGAVNDYVDNTNRALFSFTHQTGLLHGYLYAHNGGMSFAHEITKAAEGDCDTLSTEEDGIAYLDQALNASTGAHDNFEDAFVDFALDVVQGKNLTWGPPGESPYDWTAWLDPINRTPWPHGDVSSIVNAWAFEVVDAPAGGDYEIRLDLDPGTQLSSFLLVRAGENWTKTSFVADVAVPPGPHDDVAVVLVVPGQDPANYTMSREADSS